MYTDIMLTSFIHLFAQSLLCFIQWASSFVRLHKCKKVALYRRQIIGQYRPRTLCSKKLFPYREAFQGRETGIPACLAGTNKRLLVSRLAEKDVPAQPATSTQVAIQSAHRNGGLAKSYHAVPTTISSLPGSKMRRVASQFCIR